MKGVWSVLKIHIVQKGDTLWEISKKYGVDFEELKQLNSQFSSPDMIMPGMKVKIPSTSKAVKKETTTVKEIQKKETQQPYIDTSPKPFPVIKEDDHKKQVMVKPEMPVKPLPQMPTQPMMQTPIMEQEFQNYTTINFPQMPHFHEVEEETPKKEHIKEQVVPQPKPMPQLQPQPLPTLQPQPKPMPQPQPMPQQAPMHMMPLCCHVVHPCYPPVPFPAMGNMPDGFFPHHQMEHSMMPPVNMNFNEMSPNMEMAMPVHPKHAAGNSDCGCKSNEPIQPYAMAPLAFQDNNQEIQPQAMYQSQHQMPTSKMYPPQFGMNQNNNSYPNPPGYPDFSNIYNRNEDENTSE